MATGNYVYHNDQSAGLAGEITVEIVDPNSPDLDATARVFQAVMHEAWAAQFADQFKPESIAQTVDPNNAALVSAQAERLRNEGQGPSQSLFVQAKVEVPIPTALENETVSYTAGIGKAIRIERSLRRSSLADISNLFVRPDVKPFGTPLQGRGIGSAILHRMLDRFPDGINAVVYDFPFNVRTINWLASLGFRKNEKWQAERTLSSYIRDIDGGAKLTMDRWLRRVGVKINNWEHEYFGRSLPVIRLDGPPVGELRQKQEKKRPWLKDREPDF